MRNRKGEEITFGHYHVLEAAGLEKRRGWHKFERGREAPPVRSTDLSIRQATAADAPAFGRIIADAFDLGEQAAPWLARLVGRPDWYTFMSFGEDGTPADPGEVGEIYLRPRSVSV